MAVPVPGTPTPTPTIPEAVITPPQPTSRWQALRQIGWWKGIDTVLLSLLLAHIITGFFFLVFGKLSFNVAVIGFLQAMLVCLVWTVILAYRCMDFVIQLRASIEMLPYDAGRIAVGFLQGGKPLTTPVKP